MEKPQSGTGQFLRDIEFVPDATADSRAQVLGTLKDLVPSAFLDGVLDVSQLLTALGVDEGDRKARFAFTWPGIEQAREDARSSTTATLVPDLTASMNWETVRDVLIEGDNLQVLKLLKAGYSGAAKLIYIDPPYNTGESFTYNDDFSVPEPEYLRQTAQVDADGNALTSRVETQGKKHAPWLSMIFPRIAAARQLLRRDGVFLASIDNNELHHLRLLLDALFGSDNFVDTFTWRGARKGDAKLTGGGQDYVLVYARDRAYLREKDIRWRERKDGLEQIYAKVEELRACHGSDYETITKELRSWYKSLGDENPSKAHEHYNRVDEAGIWFPDNISSPNYRENLIYKWKGYNPPENGWRYEEATMERLDSEGRLIYPEDKTKRVQFKAYLHMRESWAPPSVFYRDRRAATSALNDLMGEKVFDDPKSTDVLARLFHSLTDEGDLIIDFFAGSGSTGQAVWEQNLKDRQTRHWLLVQRAEVPDASQESGKNALAEGYKTIFEITAERLRRAATQIDAKHLGLRIFRACETNLLLHAPIVATDGMTGAQYVQRALDLGRQAAVKDGADDLAVIWEIALKATPTQLDANVVAHDVAGITVYEVVPATGATDQRMFICLGAFSVGTFDKLGVGKQDLLVLRGDVVDDKTALTIAPRLQKKLILLERIPREVSL